MSKLSPGSLMRRLTCALAVLVLVTGAAPLRADDKPSVVAVNYALSYLAARLGGPDLDVRFPVPEDVDPSFWRPGIADVSAIQEADLIVLNGAGFAAWTSRASLPRSRVVDTSRDLEDRFIVTETVTHSHGADGEHSHAATASFTWLDQEQAVEQARAIASAYRRNDLVAADALETRLAALTEDLLALHASAAELRPLADGKVLIATHPRYQYFARAYGLDIRSLEWEAGQAPDLDQLAELQSLSEETGSKVLLWEARPPAAARDAVRDLGLADIVFPTMARAPDGVEYLDGLRQAVEELSAALRAVGG